MGKKARYTPEQWQKINDVLAAKLAAEPDAFGWPERRDKSVVLGSFNIRELGSVEVRSPQAWNFLERICKQFDLLAIQEVQDNLDGIRELRSRVGEKYGLVVSDITGQTPGRGGSAERLTFLFRWDRIQRTELASDISFDRSSVVETLFENQNKYQQTFKSYKRELDEHRKENKRRRLEGKRALAKPAMELPTFLTFIRQPHCASFEVLPANSRTDPYRFMVVNAHLMYGTNTEERRWEFDALIEWLVLRAKSRDSTYHENILMMGDCNFEFDNGRATRKKLEAWLKKLNSTKLKSKKAAKANFPLLDEHPNPKRNPLRTNARMSETYDQIVLFTHDKRLPDYSQNKDAGKIVDGYDYGVFRFTDLFAEALFGNDVSGTHDNGPFARLVAKDQKWIIARTEWDISDHMPVWFRLPIPGA